MSIVFNGKTIAGAPPPSDTANAAKKADLTSIIATGATNATGATIASGTYFYLNGSLVLAKADIASGASFTENTNYEAVTAGGLNSLKSALDNRVFAVNIVGTGSPYKATFHVRNKTMSRVTILAAKGHQTESGSIQLIPIAEGADADITIDSGSNAWCAPLIIYDPNFIEIS